MGFQLKILIVVPVPVGGGAEAHATRLGIGLEQRGWEVEVFAVRPAARIDTEVPKNFVFGSLSSAGSSTLAAVKAVPVLRKRLRENGPQLVYVVLPIPALLALTATIGLPNIPVVVSFQNTLLYGREQGLRKLLLRLATRLAGTLANAVVVPSKGLAFELGASGINPRKIRVIPNLGLEAPDSTTACDPKDLLRRPFRFVTCGRLVYQKGFDLLLEAAALLKQRYEFELHIIGDGPLKTALMEQAMVLGITERVRFLGWQTKPEVVMAGGNAFVLSSRWEGFGNVLVEAMSVGLPVIATRCPHGPSEILEEGNSGLLCEPEPHSIASAMEQILCEPGLRTRLEHQARYRSQHFDPRMVLPSFDRYFTEIAIAKSC